MPLLGAAFIRLAHVHVKPLEEAFVILSERTILRFRSG